MAAGAGVTRSGPVGWRQKIKIIDYSNQLLETKDFDDRHFTL
jgi:hypothetical protein